MEQEAVNRLISENMKKIFAFSITRLQNEQEAEVLASDIIYEILRSAHKLRDDSCFYAYLWKIAENTYVNYLRGKSKHCYEDLPDVLADPEPSLLEKLILQEDLKLLRRELSLLTENYRNSVILYYVENFSCKQISERLQISTEMVKYYLFRARKMIREGMNMERLFGEKSYLPQRFEIDFWGTRGGDDAEYRSFQERKIRGNLLLAAYYTPITAQELSLELGVAMPYLEDELRLLVRRQYLKESNGKYIANIPVFTLECTKAIQKKTIVLVKEAAAQLMALPSNDFAECFGCRFRDQNLMRWQMVLLCSHFSLCQISDAMKNLYGDLPGDGPYSVVNGGGGNGYVWGRCSSVGEEIRHDIEGIYNGWGSGSGKGSVIAFNFQETLNVQHFEGDMTNAVICAAVDEPLSKDDRKWMQNLYYLKNEKANYAIYSEKEYQQIRRMLQKKSAIFEELIKKTFQTAAETVADLAPEHIRKRAEAVGAMAYQFRSIADLVAELFSSGWLLPVSSEEQKPALCVILDA